MTPADRFYELLVEYGKSWDPSNDEERRPTERFWVERQKWLESRGYLLRPRYHPEWIPSWRGTGNTPRECEDGQELPFTLMDATRRSDGAMVKLKIVFGQNEIEISKYFSRERLASHPKNHCVPILEVLEVPEYKGMLILVMPHLRPYNEPRFLTIGEAVEFFRQILEGLQFMHKHYVAHRDCHGPNIMMGTTMLYPNGFHPVRINRNRNFRGRAKYYTRTERPPKYFLIDFGHSGYYDPKDGPPRDMPIQGGDKTVPEFQGKGFRKRYDPFATDIYYVGNMIQKDFMDPNFGFDFLLPLVRDMTQTKPSSRPSIDQVVGRFETVYLSLSNSQLRSRIVQRKERSSPLYAPLRWWRNSSHFFRQVKFKLQQIPAVPTFAHAHN